MSQCFFYDCDLRNNAGYCKVTACINPKYCSVTNTVDGYISARYKPTVKKTNADRIRSMADEELAGGMINIMQGWCPLPSSQCKSTCKECLLDWLKQESVDKDGEA